MHAFFEEIKDALAEYKYAVVVVSMEVGNFSHCVVGYNDLEEAEKRVKFYNSPGSRAVAEIFQRKEA